MADFVGADYVGDDEYIGDSIDTYIDQASGVGAAMARARSVRSPRGKPTATGAAPLMRSSREVFKRAPLGFGTYSLATTVSTTVTSRVQRPFHPDRLLVTSSQLGVVITSIKCGDEEQLLGGSVPAELYGVNALADSKPDDFSPMGGGIDFSITITNSAATTSTGSIGMKGDVKR